MVMILLHPIELADDSGFSCEATIRISYDHTPYEAATRDCPGSPEEVSVWEASVWVKDHYIGEHPAPLKLWEEVCWEHVRSEREAERAERMMEV
jgi:hypothetical protein